MTTTTTTIRASSSHDARSRVPLKGRAFGAIVASTVSLALATVPTDLVWPASLMTELDGLGLAGAPVAFVLGWLLTPTLARASSAGAAGIGVAVGFAAAYLGVLELALATLVAALLGVDPASGFSDEITASLFIATVGLPYGTLVLPVTIPCGLLWALITYPIVRRLAAPGRQP
jgi:hypothetical protein